jgi:hypothetical protein
LGAQTPPSFNVGRPDRDLEKLQRKRTGVAPRSTRDATHRAAGMTAANEIWWASAETLLGVRAHQLGATWSAMVGGGGASARASARVARFVVPGHDQFGMEVELGRLRSIQRIAAPVLRTARTRLEQQQSGERRYESLNRYDACHTTSIVTPTLRLEDLRQISSGRRAEAVLATESRR